MKVPTMLAGSRTLVPRRKNSTSNVGNKRFLVTATFTVRVRLEVAAHAVDAAEEKVQSLLASDFLDCHATERLTRKKNFVASAKLFSGELQVTESEETPTEIPSDLWDGEEELLSPPSLRAMKKALQR